uniref:Uncharacterized protein n=1 Tax=Oryza brachyantha TaxID=4533 RepID=J3N3Z8_ORYBR
MGNDLICVLRALCRKPHVLVLKGITGLLTWPRPHLQVARLCLWIQVGQIYQKFECKDRSDGGIVRNVVRWSIENLLELCGDLTSHQKVFVDLLFTEIVFVIWMILYIYVV